MWLDFNWTETETGQRMCGYCTTVETVQNVAQKLTQTWPRKEKKEKRSVSANWVHFTVWRARRYVLLKIKKIKKGSPKTNTTQIICTGYSLSAWIWPGSVCPVKLFISKDSVCTDWNNTYLHLCWRGGHHQLFVLPCCMQTGTRTEHVREILNNEYL